MKKILFYLVLLMAASAFATPVLFTLQSLTGVPSNRSILVQPDRVDRPLVLGTNLVPLRDFVLQPVNGQVLTNLAPWGYTIRVDGWSRSARINVPDTTNTVLAASLISTNAFSPLILQFPASTNISNATGTNVNLTGTFNDNLGGSVIAYSDVYDDTFIDADPFYLKGITTGAQYDPNGGFFSQGWFVASNTHCWLQYFQTPYTNEYGLVYTGWTLRASLFPIENIGTTVYRSKNGKRFGKYVNYFTGQEVNVYGRLKFANGDLLRIVTATTLNGSGNESFLASANGNPYDGSLIVNLAAGSLVGQVTNQINSVSGIITNGGVAWYFLRTNGTPAITAQPGSLCTTTNGDLFIRSRTNTWNLK